MNTLTQAPQRASPFALAQHWSAQDAGPAAADLTLTDRSLQTARWLQDAALPAGRVHGLYPVLRQDAALQLEGPALHTLLRQVCSVDLQARENSPDAVFLTTMVGVGVTLLWRGNALLLWADGTMGSYLWDTLAEVARDCGSLRMRPAP